MRDTRKKHKNVLNKNMFKILPFITLLLLTIHSISFSFELQTINKQIVTNGIEKITFSYKPTKDSDKILINVLRIDLSQNDIKIIDTYSTIKKSGKKYSSYSLRDLNEVTKPLIIMSGGFVLIFECQIYDRVFTAMLFNIIVCLPNL